MSVRLNAADGGGEGMIYFTVRLAAFGRLPYFCRM
jgi:hypothetical protein